MIKRYLFILFFLLLATAAFALGNKERKESLIQVTGLVRLAGNANFPEIIISGDHEWFIAKEEKNKLMSFQHCIVTVEGEETSRELKFAGGQSAGIRRELRNIKIITILEQAPQ